MVGRRDHSRQGVQTLERRLLGWSPRAHLEGEPQRMNPKGRLREEPGTPEENRPEKKASEQEDMASFKAHLEPVSL